MSLTVSTYSGWLLLCTLLVYGFFLIYSLVFADNPNRLRREYGILVLVFGLSLTFWVSVPNETPKNSFNFPIGPPAHSPSPILPHEAPQTPFPTSSLLTQTPTQTSNSPLTLFFTGDINPGRCPAQTALDNDDFTLPYQAVADELRAADITIGSLDGSISDINPPSSCPQTMNLIGPSRTVEGLQFAGFDVITVATNHAKDCGASEWGCDNQSLQDTLRYLSEAGIQPVGGGESLASARAPVIVERQGVRFAFLGVTEVGTETWASESVPGTAPLSDEALPAITAGIAAAHAEADVGVVLAQWGVEYETAPTPDQMRWAGEMIAAGATLVVGNHPHVVQAVETYPGRQVVAYALGNFVFDQQPWRARQGVVFEAVFQGVVFERWELHPIHIHNFYQPRWAEPGEAEAILTRIEAASVELPDR
jgi:poly-gamma-glutamate capsule biosynthesis protein CapA/YwtB (metallophosphatase superfamily)